MIRPFAGCVDRRGRPDTAPLEAAVAPEAGGLPVSSIVLGPLALAFAGPEPARGADGLCLIDGDVYAPWPHEPEAQLLAAWRRDGEEALLPLRADLAAVLWDGERERGLLVRDQMGGRTIVFHFDGSALRFATEVALLLRMLPRRPEPDETALAHWLGVSGMPGDKTLFAGVHRLPAAHVLTLGTRTPSPRRWWSPRYRRPRKADPAEQAERLRDTLRVAVQRRASTAADSGVLLSGGLDSSTIGAVATKLLPDDRRPARSYSATFPDHPTVDETELIAHLNESYGLRSTRIVVRRGTLLTGVLPYIERWALPPVSPNLFFWLPLFERAAADGTSVMLDGEGGDEIFGLSPYLIADYVRRGRVRGAAELVTRVPGGGNVTPRVTRRWLRYYGARALAPAWAHALSRRVRPNERHVQPWFPPRLARTFVDSSDAAAWKRIGGPRWWAYLVNATTRGMGPALAYDHIRRRGALSGVRSRHPIVDVDVIELILSLPPELAFHPEHSRPLVREAMRGLMPEQVRLRPTKSSFDAVFHAALAGPDLPLARAILCDPAARVGAYVDLDVLRRELLDPEPPPAGPARQTWALWLWRTLTAECWLRAQEDRDEPRRTLERVGVQDGDWTLVTA